MLSDSSESGREFDCFPCSNFGSNDHGIFRLVQDLSQDFLWIWNHQRHSKNKKHESEKSIPGTEN